MKNLLLSAAALCACLFIAPTARAEGGTLSLGVGYYDIFDDDEAVDVRAEWRTGYDLFAGIKPFLGLEATTDAALFGLAGLYRDFPLAPNWYLTPSAGVGAYHDGDGKDLENTLQFRTQLEIQYEFAQRNRVSVGLSHISSGGLGSNNPGAEVLNVYYHMPWN